MQSPRSSLSVLYIFKFEGNLKTFCLFAECNLPLKLGNGQNYENQNVENQKELRKPSKPSLRRKDL